MLINNIKRNSQQVEKIEVRVNSIPGYQLLGGKIDSLQMSIKKWQPRNSIVFDLVEVETDSIQLNLSAITNQQRNWRQLLQTPVAVAGRIILTEENLNKLLKSPEVQSLIERIGGRVKIADLNIDLQANNRIRIDGKTKLPLRGEELLNISLEFNLELTRGHKLEIRNIAGTLNNRPLSSRLLNELVDGVNDRLSLRQWERDGITARLLRLNTNENQLEIAGFIHIDNKKTIQDYDRRQ
ncbi:MAG: DUF2993 domain-containing protein [Geminocystis sp.]|nr:DUF2993 domain-containing protein [Geminocystis sp.]MCS7147736.1 DUF2993 domain-containing protein [Geminocystis sp.]MCX8079244.1 DUF2993 domain-containing protein [Geminocystis sp.]MDW8116690.1 DUF2993 domain-containing protein [Geminocystis sp.]MDW8463905.1 DUF2993 domain-containing protein [Geminocystis sp.]